MQPQNLRMKIEFILDIFCFFRLFFKMESSNQSINCTLLKKATQVSQVSKLLQGYKGAGTFRKFNHLKCFFNFCIGHFIFDTDLSSQALSSSHCL